VAAAGRPTRLTRGRGPGRPGDDRLPDAGDRRSGRSREGRTWVAAVGVLRV